MARHNSDAKEVLIGFHGLAVAIVHQAIKDYRKLYTSALRHKIKEDSWQIVELRKFFLSEWYECLFSYDGRDLMKAIEKECRQKLKNKKKMQLL